MRPHFIFILFYYLYLLCRPQNKVYSLKNNIIDLLLGAKNGLFLRVLCDLQIVTVAVTIIVTVPSWSRCCP